MKKIYCFIPARLKSTRLPNKMLLDVNKKKLINHVYDQCKKNKFFNEVYIATCDKILADLALENFAKFIMTSSKHKDCVSRVIEAVIKKRNINENDYIVIVQGDEACVTSKILNNFCRVIMEKKYNYYNLISQINHKRDFYTKSVVKCAINKKNEIIFMTRYAIPFNKSKKLKNIKTYRQSGIIGFTKKSLINFSKFKKRYCEIYEEIDMLRILEAGDKILSHKVNARMLGVDTKEDYKELLKII